jgi:hypothetical protein
VLPTTPVSRLAYMGCSSKWLRNVVFLVCLVWDDVFPCCLTREVQCLTFPRSGETKNGDEGEGIVMIVLGLV